MCDPVTVSSGSGGLQWHPSPATCHPGDDRIGSGGGPTGHSGVAARHPASRIASRRRPGRPLRSRGERAAARFARRAPAVNGGARIVDDADLRADHPQLPVDQELGRVPGCWVVVAVEEAYIHCRKHIPRLAPVSRTRAWGTDDQLPKGGDFFGARATSSPWSQPAISRS
jgi:hypothetical protein